MSNRSRAIRVLLKAVSAILLWLLSVSISSAAPIAKHTNAPFRADHTASVRKLMRQARTLGGPLVKRLRGSGIRLKPIRGWIQRSARVAHHDDEQAIQNDAPAATIAAEHEIELQRLGLFEEAAAPRPFTRAFSPRSPRGPPPAA